MTTLRKACSAATVLVTGIHREELGFGDQVASLLDPDRTDILRIPEGVPQSCEDVDQQFYHDARQRELYLQLHQQVKRRYELMIDLHSGRDEDGPCADIYCHDVNTLQCLHRSLASSSFGDLVKLVRITSGEIAIPSVPVDCEARTSIPEVIWATPNPLYVGLELYLPEAARLDEATELARFLIGKIQDCVL